VSILGFVEDKQFSVILAMLKYCHRLEGQQEGLLFDVYVCNKELHFSKINTWYSSNGMIIKM
jgi:hypothetical protein